MRRSSVAEAAGAAVKDRRSGARLHHAGSAQKAVSYLHQTFLTLAQTTETLGSVPRQARAKTKCVDSATRQDQAVVLLIGNGDGGQSILFANLGDQRDAGHKIMQGGSAGSILSCQLPGAGAKATT